MTIEDSQLARLFLFQSVNPDSIRKWIDQCPMESYSPGTVLLNPREENDTMYVMVEGRVSIRLESLDNPPLTHVGEGECLGEMSIFDGKNPSAWVRCETPVTTLNIQRETLLNLIDHSHGVARNLLYLLSNRLRSGNEAVTGSQLLQREYEQHANVDVLTALHNRRWINSFFNRLVSRLNQDESLPMMTVMMVDVDHFKPFNDTHGHLAGDHALRSVADILKESIRPTDMVARYGGEEFLVILPDTTSDQAEVVAERIREQMEGTSIAMGDKFFPPLTVSLGVAQLYDGDDFNSLINAADNALYDAKQGGRNKVVIAQRSTA
jgi:diguanylate cyclase (GGDEF)-like protein